MLEKYPTLLELKTKGKVIDTKLMAKIIECYWGETGPSDDYLALEIALKEMRKNVAK